MEEKKDGGAAFPDPGRAQSVKQREALTETGMTLRDYFAAAALTGLLASGRKASVNGSEASESACSVVAYVVADAMLAERAK